MPDRSDLEDTARVRDGPGLHPAAAVVSREPTERLPAKVEVKLNPQIKKLKRLEAKLKALDAQMATLVVGERFAPVLVELQTAVAVCL